MTGPATLLWRLLLFPGVGWTLLVFMMVAAITGRLRGSIRGLVTLAQRRMPLAWQAAPIATAVALAQLPWTDNTPRPNLWLLWCCVEGVQLLILLPELLGGETLTTGRAVRDGQIGAAGRVALWVTLLAGYAGQNNGHIVARVAAAIGACLAVPLALGWPPWGSAQPWAGRTARAWPAAIAGPALVTLREVTILALVATLLVRDTGLSSVAALGAQLALIAGFAALGRGVRGSVVEQRLTWGLQWWWNVVLPIAVVALVLLLLQL